MITLFLAIMVTNVYICLESNPVVLYRSDLQSIEGSYAKHRVSGKVYKIVAALGYQGRRDKLVSFIVKLNIAFCDLSPSLLALSPSDLIDYQILSANDFKDMPF